MKTRRILLRGIAVALMGFGYTLTAPDEAHAFSCTACGWEAGCSDGAMMCAIHCGGFCDTGCDRTSSECGGYAKYTCAAC